MFHRGALSSMSPHSFARWCSVTTTIWFSSLCCSSKLLLPKGRFLASRSAGLWQFRDGRLQVDLPHDWRFSTSWHRQRGPRCIPNDSDRRRRRSSMRVLHSRKYELYRGSSEPFRCKRRSNSPSTGYSLTLERMLQQTTSECCSTVVRKEKLRSPSCGHRHRHR